MLLLNRPSERADESGARLAAMAQASSTGQVTMVQKVPVDLASFDSVRRAATKMNELLCNVFGGLDALLNNAGVMGVPDTRTPDGYDVQMQTNRKCSRSLCVLFRLKAAAQTCRTSCSAAC